MLNVDNSKAVVLEIVLTRSIIIYCCFTSITVSSTDAQGSEIAAKTWLGTNMTYKNPHRSLYPELRSKCEFGNECQSGYWR